MVKKVVILFVAFTVMLSSCKEKYKPSPLTSVNISKVVTNMTDIMVRDITNPPLAARFFSYACLAGYEVVSQHNNKYKSLHGVLNDYPEIKKPAVTEPFNYQLAAILAMLETAKKMQPSGKTLNEYQQRLLDSCKRIGYDEEMITNSQNYALDISKQILAYAKADRYNKISTRPRYTPSKNPGSWYPTPPGYFDAVEPYFNTVRPFVLDSASEFLSAPPITFDEKKGSAFYNLANAVYNEGKNSTDEHRVIAGFWDCNPYAIQDKGHLLYGFKKISPGAHWMGITGIACLDAKKDFDESMKIYTSVAVGLMDAFMTCWDEKFRSNRIRPEQAIRKYIDTEWEPLLQTPPFPEYLSGHSVISSASANILTHYFGDNFQYTDSVEVTYGLPARSFPSFIKASEEAAISRFYGGIHFMDAIQNGLIQGKKVGEKVVAKMK